ncbi:MAG: FAD-dependent oxidoreductase [Aerococcus sp.]|nr:FAD-dependent oxidoreductase [Aerococcus sp.]
MKIAIIGGGIVGSVTAFYLSQTIHQVTLFDDGEGQATKAAAGIICPWFSKRRNQAWYRLADRGAHFFLTLMEDMKQQGINVQSYQPRETWLVKKRPDQIESLYTLVKQRQKQSPLIHHVEVLSPTMQQERFPLFHYDHEVLSVAGGAVIDGGLFCSELLQAATQLNLTIHRHKATLRRSNDSLLVNEEPFDRVVVAAGAWLPSVLANFPCQVDITPQKGQLALYQLPNATNNWPLIMPEGAVDIIPHQNGTLYLGATHEKGVGYNLDVDPTPLENLLKNVQPLLPALDVLHYQQIKVGTRAYTSDFSPFFGAIKEIPDLYVASGLGASGLTTGPLIGAELAKMVLEEPTTLPGADYRPDPYIIFD